MLKVIAVWILGMVDFDLKLEGDNLTLIITIGQKTVFNRTFDLIPDKRVSYLSTGEVKTNAKA